MEFAWFIYTFGILGVAFMACTTTLVVWVLTNRRDCLVAASVFLVYVLEVLAIFFDEYLRAKPLFEAYFDQGLTHPVFSIAQSVALVTCVWLWCITLAHGEASLKRVAPVSLAYLVIAGAFAPVSHNAGTVRTLVFWLARDLFVAAAPLYAIWIYRRKASEAERLDMDRHRKHAPIVAALLALMVAEDIFMITIFRPQVPTEWVRSLFWHLTERNISENLLMVFCAMQLMRYDRSVMRVFARHPQQDEQLLADPHALPDFESRLLDFADAHGISPRERDVLRLALSDKDNQAIASELFISVGTVKTHLYRIYKKAEVGNRQDLVNEFWRHRA